MLLVVFFGNFNIANLGGLKLIIYIYSSQLHVPV